MSAPRWLPWSAAVVLLVSACGGPLLTTGPRSEAMATLTLDAEPVALEITTCALVAGRLLEELPRGGSETTLEARGRLEDGQQVTITVRRGTDAHPPERFELLELTLGEVERDVASLVGFRGRDAATGAWTEVDPDAAGARRRVDGGFLHVTDARLRARARLSHPVDGRRVAVTLDATCPSWLEHAPGTA